MQFQYDNNGIRTKKTVNGVETEYTYIGSTLISQKTGDEVLNFAYTSGGAPLGFTYNGKSYYYVLNLQGDVMGIYDSSGTVVVWYVYDTWGKLISMYGDLADTVGVKNPLRYRGYYYDTETGLYYLQSRYYDPETGRFINADAYLIAGSDYIQGTNMYAYCYNNPVMYVDPTGYEASEILTIGLATILAAAACAQFLIDAIGEEQAIEALEQLVSDGADIYDLFDFVGFVGDSLGVAGTSISVLANSFGKLINKSGGIWVYQTTMPKAASAAKGIGVATTAIGAVLTGIDIYNLWANRDDLTTDQKIAGTAIDVGGFAASNAVGVAAAAAGSFVAASGPLVIGSIAIPGGVVGAAVTVTLGAAGAFLITLATQELDEKVGI